MSNPVSIPVADLNEILEDFDSIRLYRSSSQAGSYSLLTTLTLVAGTTHYTYEDGTGTSSSWYRYSFYSTVTTDESTLSDPQPAGGTAIYSRQTIRRLVAHKLRLYGYPRGSYTHPGPAGTTTATGDTDTVVAAGHINSRVPARFYTGHFLLVNSGSAANEEREISSFTPASGEFEMATPFSVAVGSGQNFDLYGEVPSGVYNEAIDDARRILWLPFRFPIAGVQNTREYPLPDFITRRSQIDAFRAQTGSTINNYQYGASSRIDLIEYDGGGMALYLPGGLSENSVWYLEGKAHPTEFLSDASTLPLADDVLDYFLFRCCQKVCESIKEAITGASEDRSVWERKSAYWEEQARGRAKGLNLGPRPIPAHSGRIVSVGGGNWDVDW